MTSPDRPRRRPPQDVPLPPAASHPAAATTPGTADPTQDHPTPGAPGVLGNERLTAMAGAILLVLSAIEIITLIALHDLITVHFFVGVLLIGPVAVKTASTGWRFLRYYTRHPAYRRKGPPNPLLRIMAPLLVASTLALLGSGIALAATGPAPPVLLQIHMLSFLAWLVTIIAHAVAYLARVPRLVREDLRHRPAVTAPVPPGRPARLAANIAALIAAAIAAVLLLPTAAPWTDWLAQGLTKVGIVAVVLILATIAVAIVRGRVRRRRA